MYGHSGGAQFVSRFLLTHPDVLGDKIAMSAAGSYLFATGSQAYPYGFNTDTIDADFNSYLGIDLSDLKNVDYVERVNQVLDKHVIVLAGENDDTVLNNSLWQGNTVPEKATSYYNSIMGWDEYLKTEGRRSANVPRTWELVIQSGIGHDSNAGFQEAQERLYH